MRERQYVINVFKRVDGKQKLVSHWFDEDQLQAAHAKLCDIEESKTFIAATLSNVWTGESLCRVKGNQS